MRLHWLCMPLLAVIFVAAACSSVGDSGTADLSTGNPDAFCLGWPETRAALQADLGGGDEWQIRGAVTVARLSLDEADSVVPASLRSDWALAAKFQNTVVKLLDIADYVPERLPQELIDAAFGEGGAEAAAIASEAGIERIDAWALDQCGDFCELWPRLDRTLGWQGEGGGDTYESIRNSGSQDEGMILLGDGLVPDAIRDDWHELVGMRSRVIDFVSSGAETLTGEEYRERFLDALEFTDQDLEAIIRRAGDPPEGRSHEWWAAEYVASQYRKSIGAWVADNCESVGVLGLPGVVRIEDPSRNLDRLLIAVMPVGTDLQQISDASDFLAVACSQPRPGEVWGSPLLERTKGFDQPCIQIHRQDLGAREAVLPAGDYELFVGSFPRGVGNFDTYVPAPELCAVVPLTVDGDTELQVPNLEPCDLGPLAGTEEEIARRQPSPTVGGPTGTLRVVLTEHLADEDIHAQYSIAVLPGGTTLNEVALGYTWPVGYGCLWFDRPLGFEFRDAPPESLEGGDAIRWRLIQEAIAGAGVPVPITSFPADPRDHECPWGADQYLGIHDDWRHPELAALPVGNYDVYVTVNLWDPEAEVARDRCSQLTFEFSGEMVIEAPPLEDCP